MKEVTY